MLFCLPVIVLWWFLLEPNPLLASPKPSPLLATLLLCCFLIQFFLKTDTTCSSGCHPPLVMGSYSIHEKVDLSRAVAHSSKRQVSEVCAYTYIYIYIYIYIQIHMYTFIYIYIYIFDSNLNMYTRIYYYIHIYIYIYDIIYIYIYVSICIYVL